MSGTKPPPAAYAETTRPVAFSVNIIVPVAGFEGSRFIKAGEPPPYCDISEVPEQLKGFIAGDEDAESQGPPGGLFELNTIYNVSPEGAILSRAGRRTAAQLAGEASWQAQAEKEAIAAVTLDPETEATFQQEHDLRIGVALKTAEIRARDADAAVAAAQAEAAGAEQKPAAIYVKRGGAWMHAERARLRPGEPVFVKEPSGAWAAVGTVNSTGGLPPPPEVT
jgi:hypothetical protein